MSFEGQVWFSMSFQATKNEGGPSLSWSSTGSGTWPLSGRKGQSPFLQDHLGAIAICKEHISVFLRMVYKKIPIVRTLVISHHITSTDNNNHHQFWRKLWLMVVFSVWIWCLLERRKAFHLACHHIFPPLAASDCCASGYPPSYACYPLW